MRCSASLTALSCSAARLRAAAHHPLVDVEPEQADEQVLAGRGLVVQEAGELVLGQHDRPGEVLEGEAEQVLDRGVDLADRAREHVAVDRLEPRLARRRARPDFCRRTTRVATYRRARGLERQAHPRLERAHA